MSSILEIKDKPSFSGAAPLSGALELIVNHWPGADGLRHLDIVINCIRVTLDLHPSFLVPIFESNIALADQCVWMVLTSDRLNGSLQPHGCHFYHLPERTIKHYQPPSAAGLLFYRMMT
jgi:hypothetical protein